MDNNKTIYISGPMTGMPNHNFDKFHEVADKFLHLGWKVINPANNFGGRSDLPREDYMRTDFVSIAKADAIVMLPGWKNSRGATAEYLVAIECGLEVYDAETLRHTEDLPMPSVMLTEDAEPFDSLPDSGSRQQFESGTVRDEASNKPRLELISPFAEMRLGHHLRRGAEKYAARNWENGIPFDRCIASLKRHLAAYQARDESEDHLASIMANSMFLAHYEAMIAIGVLPEELDDRPMYHPMQDRDYAFATDAQQERYKMFPKNLYRWFCVRIFRFTGRALPSLEDRVTLASTKFALCPALTLGQGECLVTVQTPRARRTFMIPPDLLRQIVQAISKLDIPPSSEVVPNILEKDDDKANTNKANEGVYHDLVLCQLVVDLLKAESELGIQTSGETLVLALIIFCKAAGIKVTDDWIDRALNSITSYRRTEG